MSVRKDRNRPDGSPRVAGCNDQEIRIYADAVKPDTLPWADLQSVSLMSQELELYSAYDGPIWVLRGLLNPGPYLVPCDSKGVGDLERRLLALPGFDMETYHAARLETVQREFVCWRRTWQPGIQ